MQDRIHVMGEPRQATSTKPSASAVYRHVLAREAFPAIEPTTLYELFASSCERYAENKCLGMRPTKDGAVGDYVWTNYKEVGDQVAVLASGLLTQPGVKAGCKVGVFGGNCEEWMMAMQACNRTSAVCVPLYDSLGENAIEFIINHAEAVIVLVATQKLANLAKATEKTKGILKTVVYWGAGNDAAIKTIKGQGYKVLSWEDLIKLGESKPSDPIPPKPDDLCTIMYTSGTTGDPKGVMLTHRAVIAAVTCAHTLVKFNKVDMSEADSMLSYLPLAHIFDRIFEEYFLFIGASIGYWQGDVTKLMDDLEALKPSLFIGVPRVFDRIYTKVMQQVSSASYISKAIFNAALWTKTTFMRMGWKSNQASPLFDALVFHKIANKLGGKLKLVGSGGAPLSPHVEEFLRCAMCCPVIQGYGLTETCALSTISAVDFMGHCGTVGLPTPCIEVMLESIPEMNYDALDEEPKGEVLFRGPCLFSGYYKDPKKTAEEVDADGWFHTGDIATLTKEGAIKIIDRKKNIFKLSQGEYVAVEKLESTYSKNLCAEQVWVYGNSFKSCLIAVVVPAKAALMAWAAENGVPGDFKAVCADERAAQHILAELVATAKADKLKGFEIIKAVHLEPEHFSIEQDLLTPTFKLKRPQLLKRYTPEIDAMYKSLKE